MRTDVVFCDDTSSSSDNYRDEIDNEVSLLCNTGSGWKTGNISQKLTLMNMKNQQRQPESMPQSGFGNPKRSRQDKLCFRTRKSSD
jgi:hypothetical protein